MSITSKEILLWQVYEKKIKALNEAMESQGRIIQLHLEMDVRCTGIPGDYSKLHKAIHILERRRDILLKKFNELDKKIETIAGEGKWK